MRITVSKLQMRRLLRPALLLLTMSSAVNAVAQYRIADQEIVVTANALPVPFENLSKTVTVLTADDIANLPARSIVDVLAQAASVDLESRGPFGVQTDIKLRGAAFSQVLVLVDGVRMNDTQTGHHNADFPVPLEMVERIEVLLGPGSSIYGADAFGGIVNIITRRETGTLRFSLAGGEHGYVSAATATGFSRGRFSQTVSVSGDRSDGFMYDRDFRNVTAAARSTIGAATSFTIAHSNREFGANGFYGASPSREWTNQTMATFERRFKHGQTDARQPQRTSETFLQSFYRTHGDRFLYNQDTPGVNENRHRTHATGVMIKNQRSLGPVGSLVIGAEAGNDWIRSSNLGDHSFARASVFGEMQWDAGSHLTVYPGLRLDYYSNFGSALSPSLSASWRAHERLRLRASVGRAFRIPTFTERYYRDPNHQAIADLDPEKAWAFEAGAEFIPATSWLASLTLFSRRESDVIDWIRASAAEKWHTANIHKIQTDGIELGLERSLGERARVGAHYSYINTDAGAVNYLSKYALDYARHSWSSSAHIDLMAGLRYNQTLGYKKRSNGAAYWIWDNALEKSFYKLVAEISFSNLLDSHYQEVWGVDMPGRWLAVRLRSR